MPSKDKAQKTSSSSKPVGHQYTFSKKVEMSTEKAKQKMKDSADKPLGALKRRAASTFVQKLYRDEDELNDLKVLGGDAFDSDVEDKEADNKPVKKRDQKREGKSELFAGASAVLTTTKVGRLKLEKGSVAMFAVNEVYPGQYAIVNHTRNVKGFINLKDKNWSLTPGQLVIASVQALGTSNFQAETSGHQNRKLQLSLDPFLINRGLTAETITSSMILQGIVESKESKGYMIHLGLKDKTRAFVKFDKAETQEKQMGDLVHVIVQRKTSKVIRCAFLELDSTKADNSELLQQVKTDLATVTPHTLKPGFIVSAKIQKLFTNGVEVSFLGGMTGTIFEDHLAKSNASKYKMGEKFQALVISQDIASKATALSALPSLLKLENQGASCSVGQLYNKVKVEKKVFGNSYLIKLNNQPLMGLLHKTQIPKVDDDEEENSGSEAEANEETKDLSSDDAKKRAANKAKKAKKVKKDKDANQVVNEDKDDLLDIGQVLPEVRVKEYNFFDRMPILSMIASTVKSHSLNYKTLAVGECMTGTIESVHANEAIKRVVIKLGTGFVKGILSLEHMADHPLKVIPPKFTKVGKEIKVRVFNIEGRQVELTKKDSLMKDSVPVYTALSDIRPGMKLQGLVVGKTEHGYVVKTFAGLKGLLKHDDVKEHGVKKLKTADLKAGTALKAYVLFVKKGKGIALTLSKKKAKKNMEEDEAATDESLTGKYLPSASGEEMETLISTYSSLLKGRGFATSSVPTVMEIAKYKVCETQANYYIVKGTNSKKPCVALMPKCLSSSFGIALPFDNKDFSFEAMTIGILTSEDDNTSIAVICAKPELIALKEEFVYSENGRSMVGIVENVSAKTGITLRFSNNGVTKLVALRDMATPEKITTNYQVGQVVRAAHNSKTGRVSLKRTVVDTTDSQAIRRDQAALLGALDKITSQALGASNDGDLKIGQKVQAKVQLVKDYGLILDIVGSTASMTGFIVNEQKLKTDKVYKVGDTIQDCIVLDIDFEKKIVDLSERLSATEETKQAKKADKKDVQAGSFQKAVVELNKEQYLVLSLKSDRTQVGVCVLHGLSAESHAIYKKYSIGSEIDVKVIASKTGDSEGRFILTQPRLQAIQQPMHGGAVTNASLEEGEKVVGTLKSIKGMCAFIQVGSAGKVPIIGRLHRVETSHKKNEFASLKPGDKIEAKILRKSEDKGKTMIELTKRSEHMKADGLDAELVKLLSYDTMENGQVVEGLITDVVSQDIATKVSCPVQVQISAYIRSQLLFSDILDPAAILAESIPNIGDFINSRFKTGQRIALTYMNNKFIYTGAESTVASGEKKSYEKGDLVVARFVKVNKGYGVTVQLDAKTFGVIELCELSDDITQNVSLEAQKHGIFCARVIDQDKKGRLQLSARESVLSTDLWHLIQPEGTSGKFLGADKRRQENANMRNKILKYGGALTFKQGDLTLGYVTNISKAGCFIQVAHNVSMRAGLNELSDEQDYDFLTQMPIGRVVLARITKASDGYTRFDCSLRKSLIVYGVHQVGRADIKPKAKFSCFILAVSADGVAFGQVKGSYHKLKIKGCPETTQPGQLCQVEIEKVESSKIVGSFIEFDDNSFDGEGAEKERHFTTIYSSVQEEARHDVIAAKKQQATEKKNGAEQEPDIEQLVANKRRQTVLEEQISNLQALANDEQDAEESGSEDINMVDEDDSDAEDIARLQKINEAQEKEYESSGDDNKEGDDEEEGEAEQSNESDEEMQVIPEDDGSSDEEEQKKEKKSKSGKKALQAQLEIEKKIRAKEAEMRLADGAQPKSVNDFERMLVSDYDQSYLWIQYMAFMLENLDAEAARRIVERAVKQVSMTAEDDKLNLWIAFMNLESKFGTTEQLQDVVKRALDVNDRKKVYLQLINIYRNSDKVDFVEDIYKKLCKKYFESLEIWSSYIEFLFEMRGKDRADDQQFTEPKTILQRSLQALPKANHVNAISKFGMLEYKHGNPEHGRTMFEGIVTNYPKRMDIWAIYMDMEVKYGGGKINQQQSRHLFERCLSLPEIAKKAKKMKLVFRKYMEFENALGNENKLADLRIRVEQYLEQAFKEEGEDSDAEMADKKPAAASASEEEGSASGSGSGSGDDEESEEEGKSAASGDQDEEMAESSDDE